MSRPGWRWSTRSQPRPADEVIGYPVAVNPVAKPQRQLDGRHGSRGRRVGESLKAYTDRGVGGTNSELVRQLT